MLKTHNVPSPSWEDARERGMAQRCSLWHSPAQPGRTGPLALQPLGSSAPRLINPSAHHSPRPIIPSPHYPLSSLPPRLTAPSAHRSLSALSPCPLVPSAAELSQTDMLHPATAAEGISLSFQAQRGQPGPTAAVLTVCPSRTPRALLLWKSPA